MEASKDWDYKNERLFFLGAETSLDTNTENLLRSQKVNLLEYFTDLNFL